MIAVLLTLRVRAGCRQNLTRSVRSTFLTTRLETTGWMSVRACYCEEPPFIAVTYHHRFVENFLADKPVAPFGIV